jgi:nucleoside-triphosphatase THEP1
MTSTEILLVRVMTDIEKQLSEGKPGSVIIHGEIGSGKTRFVQRLVTALTKDHVRVGGIICPRILHQGETVGYKVQDIKTTKEKLLATLEPPGVQIGRFYLSEQALAFAQSAINSAVSTDEVVVVDEVGRLELKGGGYARALRPVLRSKAVCVLCIRSAFVKDIIERFQVNAYSAFHVT